MTTRRSRRPGTADWRHSERRAEIAKAGATVAGVVLATALIIFLIKPGDSSTSTQTPIPQTSVTTTPSFPPEDTTGTAVTTPPTSPTTSSVPGATTPSSSTPAP